MNDLHIHADLTRKALVHSALLPWIASPEVGVERRMLERIGGEVARASSIVHYQPGSRFHAHTHALGEEFLVLEGVFSDEQGTILSAPMCAIHPVHRMHRSARRDV